MTEYALELSVTDPPAGPVTFVAEQAGQRPHALAIQPGGASQPLAVTL